MWVGSQLKVASIQFHIPEVPNHKQMWKEQSEEQRPRPPSAGGSVPHEVPPAHPQV